MRDNSSGTHFRSSKILRIVVPGFYLVFVAYVYAAAFTLSIYPFDTWEIGIPTFFHRRTTCRADTLRQRKSEEKESLPIKSTKPIILSDAEGEKRPRDGRK